MKAKLITLLLFLTIGTNIFSQNAKIDSLNQLLEKTDNSAEKISIKNEILSNYSNFKPDTARIIGQSLVKESEKLNNDTILFQTYTLVGINFCYLGLHDSAYFYLDNAFLKAKEIDKDKYISKSFKNIGFYFNITSNHDSAIVYYKKSLEIDQKLDDSSEIANSKLNLGVLFLRKSKLDSSLNYFLQSLNYYESTNDYEYVAYCYNVISVIYQKMENYEKAIEFCEKSIKINKELDNKNGVSQAYLNMGINYKALGKTEIAIEKYEIALELALEISNKQVTALAYSNLASAYMNLKEYKIALEYHKKSLEINKNLNIKTQIAIDLANIGETYSYLEYYSEAIKYSTEGLELAKELDYGDLLLSIYPSAIKVFEASKEYNKAYFALKEYKTLKDSLFSIEKTQNIQELQTRFETEKKDQQIQFMEEKNKLLEINKRRNLLVAIFGIIATIILSILLYFVQKNRKKINLQKQKISRQAEELKTANDGLIELSNFKNDMVSMMVHDLKIPLSSIIGYSTNKKVKTISQQMLLLIANIIDTQKFEESKMTLDLKDFSIHEAINEAVKLIKPIAKQKELLLDNQTENYIVRADKQILTRILSNLLGNAVKFTSAGTNILLLSENTKNMMKISVINEGKTIPKEQQAEIFSKFSQKHKKQFGLSYSSGIGLTFCKLAVNAHKGQIGVKNYNANSVEFWFTIPVVGNKKIADNKEFFENIDSLQLEKNDIEVAKEFLSKVENIEIFEASKFQKILKNLPSVSSKFKEWLSSLAEKFYMMDETFFRLQLKRLSEAIEKLDKD